MTNRYFSFRTAATLLFVSLTAVSASAKTHSAPDPSAAAKESLKEVERLAYDASRHAALLKTMISNPKFDPISHQIQLNYVRDEINRMGKDLATLEAERNQLLPWEQMAVNDVLPLLRDAAQNTREAIAYFADNRSRLWTDQNKQFAESITSDTSRIASTLGRLLKVDKLRTEESRLESQLGQ